MHTTFDKWYFLEQVFKKRYKPANIYYKLVSL